MARRVSMASPARSRRTRPQVRAVAPARLSVDQINALNLGLMLASAAVAWWVPFQLLLVSYIFLGPLHYLTEISWLHDRGYFTTGRYDAALLVAIGVIASISTYTSLMQWDGWAVLAMGIATVAAFVRAWPLKLALMAVAAAAAFALRWLPVGAVVFLFLLPTVIHVYGFTGLFILQGSIKSRSTWGYASFAVFLVCGAVLLLYRPPAAPYGIDGRTEALANEFSGVLEQLTIVFRTPFDWNNVNGFGRFLGFAYTYHYLNWFSKTRIIGWHTVSPRRLAAIVAVYVGSVGIYLYDAAVGYMALFALSFTHVLLEMPLDARTAVLLAGGRSPAPALSRA